MINGRARLDERRGEMTGATMSPQVFFALHLISRPHLFQPSIIYRNLVKRLRSRDEEREARRRRRGKGWKKSVSSPGTKHKS